MSDPRQEFLDVLERALQHVPHFTTPTTVPIDTSWGTFFDSSEILAAWLAGPVRTCTVNLARRDQTIRVPIRDGSRGRVTLSIASAP